MKIKIILLSIIASLALVGCGGGSSGDQPTEPDKQSEGRDTTKLFPNSFLLSSISEPSDLELTSKSKGSDVMSKATNESVITRINELLSGETPLKDVFTPELLFDIAQSAMCYGPTFRYQDHSDGTLPNSGEFPGGDLGIWTINEGNTTEACSAAQLDARMTGVKKTNHGRTLSVSQLIRCDV